VNRIKRNLALALSFAVAVYLALAVYSGLGDFESALGRFRWSLLPAILGLVLLSYVGRFVRWRYYLGVIGVEVPLAANVAIFASGLSMAISPGKLGEVLKSAFIRQVNGTPIARTAPAVVAERATDGTGMVLWGLLGALSFSFGPEVLLLFLAVAVVGIAVLRSERLSLVAERILSRLPLLDRLAPHVRVFHGASSELLGLRPLVAGTGISFVSWGFECSAVYLCSVALGVQRPFLMVVFIFAVSSLVGVGSMLPGGIGAAEAGLTGMFDGLAGLPAGLAVALTFLIRLATLWFATLIGIVGLFVVRAFVGGEAGLSAARRR